MKLIYKVQQFPAFTCGFSEVQKSRIAKQTEIFFFSKEPDMIRIFKVCQIKQIANGSLSFWKDSPVLGFGLEGRIINNRMKV